MFESFKSKSEEPEESASELDERVTAGREEKMEKERIERNKSLAREWFEEAMNSPVASEEALTYAIERDNDDIAINAFVKFSESLRKAADALRNIPGGEERDKMVEQIRAQEAILATATERFISKEDNVVAEERKRELVESKVLMTQNIEPAESDLDA